MSGTKIAIVGASLAGLTAAKTLRRCGYAGRIVLIGDEARFPYDRPPLSKEIIRGEWTAQRIALDTGELEGVDWRIGVGARALDAAQRRIWFGDGSTETFDGIVIATGASPRRLPGTDVAGVHVLRSFDDATALRADLENARRVAVVGAGFIGQEIAASCRQMGIDVMMVEARVPSWHVVGDEIGRIIAELHRSRGVDVRLGVAATAFLGDERLERIHLSDGNVVDVDVAVLGIGVQPNTAWLEGSGLEIADGVLCDETCLAAPGIVAAGDVARWPNRRYGEIRRVEHWDNAVRQGDHAARRLLQELGLLKELGGEAVGAYAPVPWFWSDQYGLKFQLVGSPLGHEEVTVSRDPQGRDRFVALFRRGDRMVAAATLESTAKLLRYRRLLEEDPAWDRVLEQA
jgi:3-phenylpropionate/trans-cinnamate dioxygenase ferredoxin reductase component